MRLMNAFKSAHCCGIVQQVEVAIGLSHLGIEIQRIGVNIVVRLGSRMSIHSNNANHAIVRKSHLPFFNPIGLRAFCEAWTPQNRHHQVYRREIGHPSSHPLLSETWDSSLP